MFEVKQSGDTKINYNTISYSAYKALIICRALSEAPCTKDDIREVINKVPFLRGKISDDNLRVYLNSLKSAGFTIEKTLTGKKRRQYTYQITETPFRLQISDIETDKMFDMYDICTYNLPFAEFLEVELFYRKLKKYLKNEYFDKKYEKHSKLQKFDLGILTTLIGCCENKDIVTVMYNSPHSGLKQMRITAYEICIRNYKLYLKCFCEEYREETIFLIDRIQNIVKIEPYDGSDIKNALPDMIYELYDFDEPLDEHEELIEKTSEYRKVKRKIKNKLLSFQRILQFGSGCKILGPELYRNEMINILKSIKGVYCENK